MNALHESRQTAKREPTALRLSGWKIPYDWIREVCTEPSPRKSNVDRNGSVSAVIPHAQKMACRYLAGAIVIVRAGAVAGAFGLRVSRATASGAVTFPARPNRTGASMIAERRTDSRMASTP